MPAPRLSVTSVRFARAGELAELARIETAADAMFASVMDVTHWPAAPPGEQRAARSGWLLVVGQPVLGFAHVVDLGGHLHLEQISVHPDAARRGLGDMLLHAVFGTVLDAGRDQVTLMTHADVPWNGPWYARRGFVPLTPAHDPQAWQALAPVRAAQERLGSAQGGNRIAMVRRISDEPEPTDAVSVIPVRDGPDGIEAFVQHRVSTMDFAAGAVVFPGGRVDPGDRAAGARLELPHEVLRAHAAAWRHTAFAALGDSETAARTVLATGVREVAEETGARIDPAHLVPWDDWVTPLGYPRRFDVRFLLHPVPGAQSDAFTNTTTEAHTSQWLPVAEIVARCEAGDLTLLPPTRTLVDELAALGSVSAAVALRPEVTAVRHDLAAARPRAPGAAPDPTDVVGS